ncbi:MAG: hypothetical protein RRA94_04205 [Bacteroidota bacterium]|nr:hypothetical protein [Bacteroidota bacterium]
MKPMITICALLLLLLPGIPLAAQQSFLVMSVKGKVTVKDNGKGSWKPVRVGDVLDGEDIVRTAYASYVKLMMDQKRLVSIDADTERALADFEALKGRNAGEGASGSILAYAARQMKRSRETKDAPVYGAVRGNLDVFTAVFPKYAVMTPEPLFQWVDAEEARQYEFILLDEEFNVIGRSQFGDDRFRYIAKGMTTAEGMAPLERDRQYHWRITRLSDGMQSDIQSFRILAQDTVTVIRQELEKLDEELGLMGADEVTLHLIRGIYYERRGLYTDAFLEYRQTIRLAPEVQEYRDMMRSLLFQMKLYAEEEYLLD